MQDNINLKVKKLDVRAVLPSKREEDAGFDLYALYDESYHILKPFEIWLAPTGIATQFPKDWVLLLHERSSTGIKGIAKRAGVIDSGYRGEIKVALQNISNKTIIFISKEIEEEEVLRKENLQRGEVIFYPQEKAIIQAILMYAPHPQVIEIEDFDEDSSRGEGGFGSSGK